MLNQRTHNQLATLAQLVENSVAVLMRTKYTSLDIISKILTNKLCHNLTLLFQKH